MITPARLPVRQLSRSAKSGPPREPPKPPAPSPKPSWGRWLLPVATLALLLVVLIRAPSPQEGTSLSYSDFIGKVSGSQVKTVDINDKGAIKGTLKDGTKFTTRIPTALDNSRLEQQLQSKNVEITESQSRDGSPWGTLLELFLPLLLIVALFVWSGCRAARTLGGGLSAIGRARAKISETERPTTRFGDVAGYEGVKQEISEIVDFLRSPERYAIAGAKGPRGQGAKGPRGQGAKGPRGVIMVGPPGTGKTLIARAAAGEAELPFLSVTGSAFVEMFVGVGASRVRDLFAEARKRAPSIIFIDEIDEIDAVGSRRGGGARLGGNDEREQTLNQLLAEMDGFDQSSGIVVLAASCGKTSRSCSGRQGAPGHCRGRAPSASGVALRRVGPVGAARTSARPDQEGAPAKARRLLMPEPVLHPRERASQRCASVLYGGEDGVTGARLAPPCRSGTRRSDRVLP